MTRKFAILVALALVCALPASAHAYIPEGFIGVSPQSPATTSDFKLMREAGVSSVRLPLNWSAIQRLSPLGGEPDWSGFDREVEIAAEEGIRIMPFVSSTPVWVAPDPLALPVGSAWQRWAWANFLRATQYRYGPEGEFWEERPELDAYPIRKWEIWNEQNIITFASDPDPVRYATLLRISGRVLHNGDPGAKVILGGFFGRPLQVPPNVATGDYLSRVYRAGKVKPYFDGVALHPYVAEARAMRAQILNMRRIMASNGDAATPIYLTELGWGSRGGPTRWERGLYGQARQLSQAFSMISTHRLDWRLGGVWWFTWSDEGGSCQFCRSAGLLTDQREAKPSWYRFNAWTGGDPNIVPRADFGDEPSLEVPAG
jgi:polysaccharide biosynthesis protein PslG